MLTAPFSNTVLIRDISPPCAKKWFIPTSRVGWCLPSHRRVFNNHSDHEEEKKLSKYIAVALAFSHDVKERWYVLSKTAVFFLGSNDPHHSPVSPSVRAVVLKDIRIIGAESLIAGCFPTTHRAALCLSPP
jgi:hypothetical protein